MNAPHITARCYKWGCTYAPKHIVTVMQGVTIKACDKHLEDAKAVAQTGRPG